LGSKGEKKRPEGSKNYFEPGAEKIHRLSGDMGKRKKGESKGIARKVLTANICKTGADRGGWEIQCATILGAKQNSPKTLVQRKKGAIREECHPQNAGEL